MNGPQDLGGMMGHGAIAPEPDEPIFHADWEARTLGVTLACGALGHWITLRGGHISRYQIIAPTTWNFSPRDAADIPGALEQALVGLPEDQPLLVQHVVRSFDPCMVCTVH